jgi:WD40 repeat protein
MAGHIDRVKSIAYSPQGHLLASGGWDKTIRLWDVATGQCRATLQNLPGTIHDVTWSTTLDDNYLISGCGDGSVLKWQVIEEEEEPCHVRLHWAAKNNTLTMTGVSIQDVHGLSPFNIRLLKQRGAVGEPGQEASKLIHMTPMLSKLDEPSDGVEVETSSFDLHVGVE